MRPRLCAAFLGPLAPIVGLHLKANPMTTTFRTHDGRTLRYPDPLVRVNDTVKFDLTTNKMVGFIKFDTGAHVMVTGGRNMGRAGQIIARERHHGGFDIVHVRDPAGREFSTRLNNIFVIGDHEKRWISMPRGGGVKLTITEERDQRRKQREHTN